MLRHGIPKHIRSDNGPEFVAKAVREWLSRLEVGTLFIEPGSPWENGYIESFNGKLRDELLNGEIFTTLEEAKVLTEVWRREHNQVRPHSSLGHTPPAPTRRQDRSSQPHPNSGCGYIGGGRSDWYRLTRSVLEERMEQVREIDGEQAYEKMRRAVEKAWIFREAKD